MRGRTAPAEHVLCQKPEGEAWQTVISNGLAAHYDRQVAMELWKLAWGQMHWLQG